MTEEKQQNQDRPLAFTPAQRFFCAWLIRLRAAADIRRTPPAGRPGLPLCLPLCYQWRPEPQSGPLKCLLGDLRIPQPGDGPPWHSLFAAILCLFVPKN
jgi:hypothetical protein